MTASMYKFGMNTTDNIIQNIDNEHITSVILNKYEITADQLAHKLKIIIKSPSMLLDTISILNIDFKEFIKYATAIHSEIFNSHLLDFIKSNYLFGNGDVRNLSFVADQFIKRSIKEEIDKKNNLKIKKKVKVVNKSNKRSSKKVEKKTSKDTKKSLKNTKLVNNKIRKSIKKIKNVRKHIRRKK